MPAYLFRHRKTLAALVIVCAIGRPAAASPITWDPSAIGLAGSSLFTADALKANEVSHIVFTGPTTFIENGFAKVTGVLNNGVVSTPSGLNSTYSLYFDFSVTGDVITGFTAFTMTLYGVDGVAVFGIDGGNNAFVDNGANVPVALATNSLISGSVAGAPGSDLSAESLSIFSATVAGTPVFLSPQLPAKFHGAFFHSATEPGGITFPPDGSIVLQGGDDTLTFVPEPSSLILLLGGVPVVLFLRRRRGSFARTRGLLPLL